MSMAFYETYRRLCQNLGKSDNAVAAEIGLSNSTVTTWRQCAIPRRPTIKKVADQFHGTVEEMVGYSDTTKAPTPEGEREIENPDIRMIARAGKKMTPEQAENLRKYAQFMYPEAFKE